jgi:hypothetical protein
MREYDPRSCCTHFALITRARGAMSIPAQYHNSVLDRTIRNIEQAQGLLRHHTAAADIFQTPAHVEEIGDVISLSSLDMTNFDSPVSISSIATYHTFTPGQPQSRAPINLTSDLLASTTLLQSLRTRNSILAADLARATQSLVSHESRTGKERISKAKWRVAATCSLLTWAVYLWWCWVMRVEFAYIRRRGEHWFGA